MKPKALALDVVETLFSLEAFDRVLVENGLPAGSSEMVLTETLRCGFALEVSQSFKGFGEVAKGTLALFFERHGLPLREEALNGCLSSLQKLKPHPDVAAGLDQAGEMGFRVIALTNGSAKITAKLFSDAGLDDRIERIVTIEEIQRWKPAAAVYRHAASTLGVAPEQLALIAAHDWDVHGARSAGLVAGWLNRGGSSWHSAYLRPTVEDGSLEAVIRKLAKL